MLLRPQTIVAAFGSASPRNAIGAKGVQIYAPGGMHWSKKALIMRNAPYTIENPTLGQIETRLTFADIASRAKGERGFIDGLPAVAYRIREAMTGYRAADRMDPEAYPSKIKRTFHTAEDLRAMLEKKAAARRAVPARY